jgi:hypothetical protein
VTSRPASATRSAPSDVDKGPTVTVEVTPEGALRVLVENVIGDNFPGVLADAHTAIGQALMTAALEQVNGEPGGYIPGLDAELDSVVPLH